MRMKLTREVLPPHKQVTMADLNEIAYERHQRALRRKETRDVIVGMVMLVAALWLAYATAGL